AMKEMVGGCCVCSDERGWAENPLVYCDGHGCSVAVHQACYGIVHVPTGPWFCRKCESQERAARVRCELCPHKDGALKRTDNGGWAHVVCALYIPEVQFANVSTMEPIVLQYVPHDRYNKTCYLCEEQGRESKAATGACMTCNKHGCRQAFHVTCAQMAGLLCEEEGVGADNVKYCGYCKYHYSKMQKGRPAGRSAFDAGLGEAPSHSQDKHERDKKKNREKEKQKRHKRVGEPSPLLPSLTVTTEKTYTSPSGAFLNASLKRLDDPTARFTHANFKEVPVHSGTGSEGSEGKGQDGKKKKLPHGSGQKGKKGGCGEFFCQSFSTHGPFPSHLTTGGSGAVKSVSLVQSAQELLGYVDLNTHKDGYAPAGGLKGSGQGSGATRDGPKAMDGACQDPTAVPSKAAVGGSAAAYEHSSPPKLYEKAYEEYVMSGFSTVGGKRSHPCSSGKDESGPGWENKRKGGGGRAGGAGRPDALPTSSRLSSSSNSSSASSVASSTSSACGSSAKSPSSQRNGSFHSMRAASASPPGSCSHSPPPPGLPASGTRVTIVAIIINVIFLVVVIAIIQEMHSSGGPSPLFPSALAQPHLPTLPPLQFSSPAFPPTLSTQSGGCLRSPHGLAPAHLYGSPLSTANNIAALPAITPAAETSALDGAISTREHLPAGVCLPCTITSDMQVRFDAAPSAPSGRYQSTPTSIEQLLERQLNEGQHFLIEQAAPPDVIGYLRGLHRLQTENRRLEEQIRMLTARRERLMLLSSQLALPLGHAGTVLLDMATSHTPLLLSPPPTDLINSNSIPSLVVQQLPQQQQQGLGMQQPLGLQHSTVGLPSMPSMSVQHQQQQQHQGAGLTGVQQQVAAGVGAMQGGAGRMLSGLPGSQISINGLVGALNSVVQTPAAAPMGQNSSPNHPTLGLSMPSSLGNSISGLALLQDQQRQILMHQQQSFHQLLGDQLFTQDPQQLMYHLMQQQQQQQQQQHQQQGPSNAASHEQHLAVGPSCTLPPLGGTPVPVSAPGQANPFLSLHSDQAALKVKPSAQAAA
uniref:MLLT10 histone lysine methyltransferase DOT1L cofactor n=1 Tax=Petromyzon marinus TaxID=7757 RepID=S4RW90_PETMA